MSNSLVDALQLGPRVRRYGGGSKPPCIAYFVETGDANLFWSTAVPGVAERGFRVMLVTLQRRGPLHADLEERGVATFALGAHGTKRYPEAAFNLGRLLRREAVDVLQSCAPIQATVGGVARALHPRTIHAFQRHHMQANARVQEVMSTVATRLSHYTLAISGAAAAWARDVDGVPAAKVRLTYLGVPAHRPVTDDEVARLRETLGIAGGAPAKVILVTGYLRAEKGHRVLLDALPLVRSAVAEPVHVVIVGKGPEEAALREYAGDDPMVHFVGFQEELAPWFALADVVAMPSRYEAFGLVAVETFAARRPLVASDVGGLRDVVAEGSGILVPPDDPGALGRALASVLASEPVAAGLAEAGYERFQRHFTLDAMVEGWCDVYRDVLQLSGQMPRQLAPGR